jgi:hypothetical protein
VSVRECRPQEKVRPRSGRETGLGQKVRPRSGRETGPGASVHARTDPLTSWNDGPARQAIVTFVEKVTTEGSPDFVPPAERTSFSIFSTSLMDGAKKKGWVVINMKGDWKRIFAFEP